MGWTMFYLFVALKVPILALAWIVWWAVRSEPEPATDAPDDDGGTKFRARPHPRSPRPRSPRRGPHGDPASAPPARVRGLTARGKARGGTPSR